MNLREAMVDTYELGSISQHDQVVTELSRRAREIAGFYQTMVVMTLPFVWTGMALTVRRLRSAGLPPALSLLFFVPFVNFLFFLALASLPRVPAVAPGRFLDRFVG